MMKKILRAIPESISAADEIFEQLANSVGLSEKSKRQMLVVIDEVLSNIINYAYPDRDGEFEFQVNAEEGRMKIVFIDSGLPFNPLQSKDPDVTLSVEERKRGGLGIFLVKKLADQVEYAYDNGRNILSIWKNMEPVRKR